MNIVDVTLLVLLGGFILAGFWFGAIHMVGSIVGVVVGAVAAGQLHGALAAAIEGLVGGNANLAKLIAFAVIFILVTRLVGLAFWVIEKIFKFVAIIPFLKTFNRLVGAALGLIEGTLALGLGVWFAAHFPATAGFGDLLAMSAVAKGFYAVGAILSPLLPLAVRAAQSVI
jgi:uncharacterized membrane protein required for colicin V production